MWIWEVHGYLHDMAPSTRLPASWQQSTQQFCSCQFCKYPPTLCIHCFTNLCDILQYIFLWKPNFICYSSYHTCLISIILLTTHVSSAILLITHVSYAILLPHMSHLLFYLPDMCHLPFYINTQIVVLLSVILLQFDFTHCNAILPMYIQSIPYYAFPMLSCFDFISYLLCRGLSYVEHTTEAVSSATSRTGRSFSSCSHAILVLQICTSVDSKHILAFEIYILVLC
jgi:hypothetical protein